MNPKEINAKKFIPAASTVMILTVCIGIFISDINSPAYTTQPIEVLIATFSHASIGHLAANMFVLLLVGFVATIRERAIVFPIVVTGYISTVVFILIRELPVIGLSGGINGGMTYVLTIKWAIFVWLLATAELMFIGQDNIAHVAHFVGATLGLCMNIVETATETFK